MKKRLLVVEDSRGVRSYLNHYLGPHFEVHLAEDGRQGLELAGSQLFDLVLSDINLPYLTGIQLHGALCRSHPDLPVVLMTDADIDTYLNDALSGRIAHIIAKATLKADPDGVLRLLHDIQRGTLFGMERRLGNGGEVRTYVVGSEEELPEVLKQCQRILEQFPRRAIYHRILPELIRNALTHGLRPLKADPGRSDLFVRISVGADWHRVGLGVSDPGGLLTHQKILGWLVSQLRRERDPRTTGNGLLLSRRFMDQTFINVRPGVQTEILCFDLLQGYTGPRSLHVHEEKLEAGSLEAPSGSTEPALPRAAG